jgi:hypothetical protein
VDEIIYRLSELKTCLPFDEGKKSALMATYLRLINHTLPARFTQPVRFNHCFSRIVLDWIFQDCWYNHLHKKRPAYQQLTEAQLQSAIARVNEWLHDEGLLVQDNEASLRYRKKSSIG